MYKQLPNSQLVILTDMYISKPMRLNLRGIDGIDRTNGLNEEGKDDLREIKKIIKGQSSQPSEYIHFNKIS